MWAILRVIKRPRKDCLRGGARDFDGCSVRGILDQRSVSNIESGNPARLSVWRVEKGQPTIDVIDKRYQRVAAYPAGIDPLGVAALIR